MQNYTKEEILTKVKASLAEVLGISEDEIDRDDSLIRDLGVDSLDFLDLAFRLESTFGIRLRRGEIEDSARAITGLTDFEVDGKVTTAGLEALQKALPEVPKEQFHEGLTLAEIPSLFTVMTFVRLVETRLNGGDDDA